MTQPPAAQPPVTPPPTAQIPVVPPNMGLPPMGAPPTVAPPARRNPLLIPGIIFGVVCALLLGAVIVYALTSGGDESTDAGPQPAAAATSSASARPSAAATPSATAGGLPGASGSASASASARPSATSAACILGVWLEEKHDEQITVLNTGTFPFTGKGAYHRYSDTGRVVIDYGDGVHLTGSNGATNFDYGFVGFISYSYKIDNGVITYSAPHPDGTETFVRNGHTDYSGPLEPRVPRPMRINCGTVAMSLTNDITTIQLKRTSTPP